MGRTICPSLPDVGVHLLIAVFSADVALGSEEELDILLGGAQDGRQFRRHAGLRGQRSTRHPHPVTTIHRRISPFGLVLCVRTAEGQRWDVPKDSLAAFDLDVHDDSLIVQNGADRAWSKHAKTRGLNTSKHIRPCLCFS